MYFGSVKFFKHLILSVTALLIIIPTVTAIVLGSKLGVAEDENKKLKEKLAAQQETELNGYTAEQMLELYKSSLNDKKKYLSLLSEYDPQAYDSFNNGEAAQAAVTEGVLPIEDPAAESGEEDLNIDAAVRPAYEKLYPELYAEGVSDIVYDMDMDCVYLTFDDGPSRYTDSVLWYLDEYDIKATFFVVPDGSDASNERLKKIAGAGHTIGIHTASHVYKDIYESVESYLTDFKLAYDRVYEATGVKCSLFRFPGGSINDYNSEIREELIAEMTRRGFIYFDWNVDSSDALGATWTEMYNNVLSQTANVNRAVILMHDTGENTVLVLEDIIKALSRDSRGYKFDRLTPNVKPIQF